jgi:hypothetical protein
VGGLLQHSIHFQFPTVSETLVADQSSTIGRNGKERRGDTHSSVPFIIHYANPLVRIIVFTVALIVRLNVELQNVIVAGRSYVFKYSLQ